MTTEIAPLTAKGKDKMFQDLKDHGLNEDKMKAVLFDQAVMAGVKARAYNQHYAPERKKIEGAIRNITALQNNPALDFVSCYTHERRQLQGLKESFRKKRNELYPNPKGQSYLAAVGAKVVNLFNIILPVVKLINSEAGRKKYFKTDIYKLIAALWNDTYGKFEQNFTYEQVDKLRFNNKSKIP